MRTLRTRELRQLFLDYFEKHGHAILPSASLIPENDPTVLFTTAGMHPLVPYLLGENHPAGTRLANCQKCVRTGDIDEVGDASHSTFFEMLGNWSLGDYFKEEAIKLSWNFLTNEEYLGIDKERLYFTCFAGDDDAPRDLESANYWMQLGVAEDHIFFLPKKYNWWGPAGMTGPCGPDTEMFIDTGKPACCDDCSPACDCGKYLEIWNDVFMQYNKLADGSYVPLKQQNVDTGMGLDRCIATLQGVSSVYETDIYEHIIESIARLSNKSYGDSEEITKAFRIIADHIRCATFMIGDSKGITPSNVDQGYVLRRLIRRAIRFAMQIDIPENSISQIARAVIDTYGDFYTELEQSSKFIIEQIDIEENRFQRTLRQGIKEFDRIVSKIEGDLIDGTTAFRLYDTFGFPIEMTTELAAERNLKVDTDGFDAAFKQHQQKSQSGAEQRFKGGLADASEQTTALHTATHLLQSALRKVLGSEVAQKGSNITAERLRFDFSFPRKVTKEELSEVEQLVNQCIENDLPVSLDEMSVEQAKEKGAIGLFESKYDSMVKVYSVGDFSCEICGGPHVTNTGLLGKFKIKKEEASSAGVRRIKAVLIK